MFRLQIRTENAAFDGDDALQEIATILRDAANRISDSQMIGTCRDHNGNVVGKFEYRSKAR